MESTSEEATKLDETDSCLDVLIFNDHDEDRNGICMGDVDKIIQESLESLPTLSDGAGADPKVGLEFESKEAARDFYVAYGRCSGFTVRIHHNRRSRINNMVIGQDFVCSKEGFREKKYTYRKDRVLPPPPTTREGCHAMLRVAIKDGAGWVVTKFVKEHNHALMDPGKVPWRGSEKKLISEDEKDQRIKELTVELHNEKQKCKRRCAAYEDQIRMLLNFVEEHTGHMSRRVEDVVKNIKQVEDGQLEVSVHRYS